MKRIKSEFIVKLQYALQEDRNLYLVMDLMSGGDLWQQLKVQRSKSFQEKVCKFFIACLIQALEAVHALNIVHKDIKPLNIVFDEAGYLRLTDFGISKELGPKGEQLNGDQSGTPKYIAPEVLKKQKYGKTADFWSMGVTLLELAGIAKVPFQGENKAAVLDKMKSEKAFRLKQEDLPIGWSKQALLFINRCLNMNPKKRIGHAKGISELKSHAWFKGFDWEALASRQMQPPFMPSEIAHPRIKYSKEDRRAQREANNLKEYER